MLRAMATAPKDGTTILIVYGDFSGVVAVYWGVAVSDGEEGWFEADGSDIASAGDAAGWLEFPKEVADLIYAHGPFGTRARKPLPKPTKGSDWLG